MTAAGPTPPPAVPRAPGDDDLRCAVCGRTIEVTRSDSVGALTAMTCPSRDVTHNEACQAAGVGADLPRYAVTAADG